MRPLSIGTPGGLGGPIGADGTLGIWDNKIVCIKVIIGGRGFRGYSVIL